MFWLLDRSGRLVLSLLGQAGKDDRAISDEEIRMVIAEARSAGVMEQAEPQMIAGVMRIADRTACGLTTPCHKVELVEAGDSHADVVRRFRKTGRARLPVREACGLLNGPARSRLPGCRWEDRPWAAGREDGNARCCR